MMMKYQEGDILVKELQGGSSTEPQQRALYLDFQSQIESKLMFQNHIKITSSKEPLKEMKYKFIRKADVENDTKFEKQYQNLGFYFKQPDCQIFLYKPQDEKSAKNIDVPIIKAWIEQRQQKKQEWILVIYFDVIKANDYSEKKCRKYVEKIKSYFAKEVQHKIVKFLYVKDTQAETNSPLKQEELQLQKALIQLFGIQIGSNIDQKVDLYESQILYQQMRAKNSQQDYFNYLVLAFGRVFLNIRLGQVRQAFELIQVLTEIGFDKSRICIDLKLDPPFKGDLKKQFEDICLKINLYDWTEEKIIDCLQNERKDLQVLYMLYWVTQGSLYKVQDNQTLLLADNLKYQLKFGFQVSKYLTSQSLDKMVANTWYHIYLQQILGNLSDKPEYSSKSTTIRGHHISLIYQYINTISHIEECQDERVLQCLSQLLQLDKMCSISDYVILEYDKLYQQNSHLGERLKQMIQIQRTKYKDIGQEIKVKDEWMEINQTLLLQLHLKSRDKNQALHYLIKMLLCEMKEETIKRIKGFYEVNQEAIDKEVIIQLHNFKVKPNAQQLLKVQQNDDESYSLEIENIDLKVKVQLKVAKETLRNFKPVIDLVKEDKLIFGCQNSFSVVLSQGIINSLKTLKLSIPQKPSNLSFDVTKIMIDGKAQEFTLQDQEMIGFNSPLNIMTNQQISFYFNLDLNAKKKREAFVDTAYKISLDLEFSNKTDSDKYHKSFKFQAIELLKAKVFQSLSSKRYYLNLKFNANLDEYVVGSVRISQDQHEEEIEIMKQSQEGIIRCDYQTLLKTEFKLTYKLSIEAQIQERRSKRLMTYAFIQKPKSEVVFDMEQNSSQIDVAYQIITEDEQYRDHNIASIRYKVKNEMVIRYDLHSKNDDQFMIVGDLCGPAIDNEFVVQFIALSDDINPESVPRPILVNESGENLYADKDYRLIQQ